MIWRASGVLVSVWFMVESAFSLVTSSFLSKSGFGWIQRLETIFSPDLLASVGNMIETAYFLVFQSFLCIQKGETSLPALTWTFQQWPYGEKSKQNSAYVEAYFQRGLVQHRQIAAVQ